MTLSTLDELNDDRPCNDCDFYCDYWEARYCCTLCRWIYGDNETPCDDCDPMDI